MAFVLPASGIALLVGVAAVLFGLARVLAGFLPHIAGLAAPFGAVGGRPGRGAKRGQHDDGDEAGRVHRDGLLFEHDSLCLY
ncbi:hypothetical protein D3C77_714830 [compost metagenome]